MIADTHAAIHNMYRMEMMPPWSKEQELTGDLPTLVQERRVEPTQNFDTYVTARIEGERLNREVIPIFQKKKQSAKSNVEDKMQVSRTKWHFENVQRQKQQVKAELAQAIFDSN